MTEIRLLPPAAKYIRKLKNKKLKEQFKLALEAVAADPQSGAKKKGDLSGMYGITFVVDQTKYELLYTLESEPVETIVVLLAGTMQNSFEQLKRTGLI